MNRFYTLLLLFLLPQGLLPAAASNSMSVTHELIKLGFTARPEKNLSLIPWTNNFRCIDGELFVCARFTDAESRQVIGELTGVIKPLKKEAELKAIQSHIRRQNIGSLMLRWFLQQCSKYQVKELFLTVMPFGTNPLSKSKTRQFYFSNGAYAINSDDLGFEVKPKTALQPDQILCHAARIGSTELMELALQHPQSGEALQAAFANSIRNGHVHLFDRLKKAGCSIDTQVYVAKDDGSSYEPILTAAVDEADEKFAANILALNPDVNQRDVENRTPLHAAVEAASSSLIELLVEHRADVCTKIGIHDSILHYADRSHPSIVTTLIKCKAEVNARNRIGETPLHHAAKVDGCVQLLLDAKADPTIADINGNLPRHVAADALEELLYRAEKEVSRKRKKRKMPASSLDDKLPEKVLVAAPQ